VAVTVTLTPPIMYNYVIQRIADEVYSQGRCRSGVNVQGLGRPKRIEPTEVQPTANASTGSRLSETRVVVSFPSPCSRV
jgi:hypothetical protein